MHGILFLSMTASVTLKLNKWTNKFNRFILKSSRNSMATTHPTSRQLTESELFPGERILWMRETPTAIRERISEMATEFWVVVIVISMLLVFVFILPLMLAPMLHEAIPPLLLLLVIYRTVHFIWRCYRRRFRQWEVITNRRILFFKHEWQTLHITDAPLRGIRLIPENRGNDGSADLSICGPRSMRSHLPAKAFLRVENADALLTALRDAPPESLPLPETQQRPHPLLPVGEGLLAEGMEEPKADSPLKFRILTGVITIYLLSVGVLGLLYPSDVVHPGMWAYWGILMLLTMTVAFFQWKNRHEYTTGKRFVLGSRFLYVEGRHPRPITGCYPVRKTIYPDGRVDLDFNYPGKAFRKYSPMGLDNLRNSLEIEQLLHTLCSPTAGK